MDLASFKSYQVTNKHTLCFIIKKIIAEYADRFMWIMGVCMPMSLRSCLRRKEAKRSIFAGMLRRSCLLFLLGLVNNSLGANIDLDRLRVPGVLQRFAVTYLVVGVTALVLTPSDGQFDVPRGAVSPTDTKLPLLSSLN